MVSPELLLSGTENGFLRPMCPKSVPDALSARNPAESGLTVEGTS